MNRIVLAIVLAGLCAGCAAPAPAGVQSTATPAEGVYTGEVWNWDTETNVVTLLRRGDTVRIVVQPSDLSGLRLHEIVTLRGQPAPPLQTPLFVTAPGPVRPVPRGPVTQGDLKGTVVAASPDGRVVIDSPRGRLELKIAESDLGRFKPGTPVDVRMSIQGVDLVPAEAPVPPPSPLPQPSASVATEPGDYAVVIGRVLVVDSAGTVIVDAPQRPITVWLPDATRYRAGETVQVRTSVHPQ